VSCSDKGLVGQINLGLSESADSRSPPIEDFDRNFLLGPPASEKITDLSHWGICPANNNPVSLQGLECAAITPSPVDTK